MRGSGLRPRAPGRIMSEKLSNFGFDKRAQADQVA